MGDFFRDYGTQLALAIAAINTIITIIIGQYFKDSPRARIVFVIVSAALILLGVGASFYSQYQIEIAANAEKAHHLMIREGIGRSLVLVAPSWKILREIKCQCRC